MSLNWFKKFRVLCGFWCGQLVVWMIGDDKDLAPYTTVLCNRSFMYFAQITARNNILKNGNIYVAFENIPQFL